MKLLLDTCTFLWITAEPSKMSQTAAEYFEDSKNVCYLSSVSAWEIAVLVLLGRISLTAPIEVLVPRVRRKHGIRTLKLTESAAMIACRLPPHHRDPFDRMLICQTTAHGMTILTPDAHIARYSVPVIW